MNKVVHGVRATGRKIFIAACSLFFITCLLGMSSRPKAKVFIKKLKNNHYQLIVERKPYIVKGVCYSPIPAGQNHEFDWWSSPNEPWVLDGELMQQMGINTVRFYQAGENPEMVKRVIRDLYERYGIRTILGHWLGFWEYPCPFYGDKVFQDKVRKEVLDMVNLYKDEPGILFWILGNENNYSFLGITNYWSTDEIDKEPDSQKQKSMRAKIYYSFVNELAKEIHKIDANHPVALGNGELIGLETANEYCPDIDLVACIIYRGKTFGNLFKSLRATFDRPILLSEFGADAYDAYLGKEDQNMQAFFIESQWRQIYKNLANGSLPLTIGTERSRSANNKEGEGNCIGGTMFEWTDEWWKYNESAQVDNNGDGWGMHNNESNWSNSSYYFDIKAKGNKNMNEEWFGIVALSEESKRIPRKSYYVVREFWKNPAQNNKDKKKVKPK